MALEGFGKRLKAVRQERGYTQKQLANLLGVTEQAVSKYERGNSYPDIVMLDGISRVLDCSLDYLFEFESGRKNLLSQNSIENRMEVARHLLPEVISLEFGEKLVPLFLEEIKRGCPHVNSMREQIAEQWGVVVPAIRLMDQVSLGECQYQIRIHGVPVNEGNVKYADKNVEALTVPDLLNEEVLFELLGELRNEVFRNIGQVLTNQSIYFMVENLREKYPYVVEGIVPEMISYSRLRQVIICLLRDIGYTASPLALIIEAVEMDINVMDVRELAERVAKELGEGFRLENWRRQNGTAKD